MSCDIFELKSQVFTSFLIKKTFNPSREQPHAPLETCGLPAVHKNTHNFFVSCLFLSLFLCPSCE